MNIEILEYFNNNKFYQYYYNENGEFYFHRFYKEYYPNGNINKEFIYIKGKQDGLQKQYYDKKIL